MDEREKLARIRLIQTRHIGPMTFSLLIQRYGSALAALAAIPDLAARGGRKLSIASLANAKAELAANDDAQCQTDLAGQRFLPASFGAI
jgi:DNA processing protein